jgi:hypothetical protein
MRGAQARVVPTLAVITTLLSSGWGSSTALAAALDEQLVAGATEVVEARSARTKRYLLPGRSGTFAEVATGRLMHVRDAAGTWRDSRPTLVARGGALVADELPQAVAIRPDGIAVADLSGNGGVIFLGGSDPTVAGLRARMRTPGDILAWDWTVSATELKLASRPVRAPRGLKSYAFPYALWGGPSAVDRR